MSTTTTPTPTDVIEAMRSIHTESDRWRLAEALAARIPSGDKGLDEIVDAAAAAGVLGNLSKTTLRLYRDAANRWPAEKRVPNVSFSAHREAMVLDNISEAAKLLASLAKNSDKVTVASVRRAVAVKRGTVPAEAAKANGSGKSPALDVLADLQAGAPQIIAAIGAATTPAELDKLNAGLNKALAHVDRLRAKAAKAATKRAAGRPAPKAATPRKAPATKAPAKAATPRRKAVGDLRGE
jgi:hypothetical protein